MNPAPAQEDVPPLLRLEGVGFGYPEGGEVLREVDMQLRRGETVALLGASGCGKSTLLFVAGLLARPQSGQVLLDGLDTGALSEGQRERLRSEHLGFVFQHHFLLPDFTAQENVAMPLWIQAGRRRNEALARAAEVLEFVGLGDKLRRLPNQLSGGERQRVSVARALAHGPDLVLADEPTGSLDSENGDRVFQLLLDLQGQTGTGILLVTHNPGLAERCDRIHTMADGQLVESPSSGLTAG